MKLIVQGPGAGEARMTLSPASASGGTAQMEIRDPERDNDDLKLSTTRGPKGDPGPMGPPGPQGDPGPGIASGGTIGQVLVKKSNTDYDTEWVNQPINYTHNQIVAEATWTITHNLNKHPSVTVVDSADSVVVGDVTYTDNNSLTITFQGEFSGKAYLN